MNNNYAFIMDVCGTLNLDALKLFSDVTKQAVKALARSEKTNGANLTCQELIAKSFNDTIMEDLQSVITMELLSGYNGGNIAFATSLRSKKVHIVLGDYSYKDKTISGFLYCCALVRKYLESNHSIKGELVIDDFVQCENGEDVATISAHDKNEYIKAVSNHMTLSEIFGTYDTIKDFLKYVNDKYPKLYKDVALILKGQIIDNLSIDATARKYDITLSRAYYIQKRLKTLYMGYNPIIRKTIEFMPIVKNIDMNSKIIGYKRVYSEAVKMDIAGKATKATIYRDIDGNIIEKPIKYVNGRAVECNVKKYVLNYSKNPMRDDGIVTTYKPALQYDFRYSDSSNKYLKSEIIKTLSVGIREKTFDYCGKTVTAKIPCLVNVTYEIEKRDFSHFDAEEYRINNPTKEEILMMYERDLKRMELENTFHEYESKTYKYVFENGVCVEKIKK